MKPINLLLNLRIDHLLGAAAVGAGEFGGGAEEAADEGAFVVDLAAVGAEVGAAEFGEGFGVFLFRFDGEACHLFAGGGDGAAAVVAAGFAFEAGDFAAEEFYLLFVAGHGRCQRSMAAMICSASRMT